MIDGIRLQAIITDRAEWVKGMQPFRWFAATDTETGEIRGRIRSKDSDCYHRVESYKACLESYQLTIREVTETNTKTGNQRRWIVLRIDGSLHKNHEGGTNFKPFTFPALQAEIKRLCSMLNLRADKVEIKLIETGFNIPFPRPVFAYLKANLLTYKFSRFSAFRPDSKGRVIGFECSTQTEYRVKIYDKALQNDMPLPLMRFELRFFKMRAVKKLGVSVLSDLSDHVNLQCLYLQVLKAWEQVLITEDTFEASKLKRYEDYELMRDGANPLFWERLHESNGQRCRDAKKRFVRIIDRNGKNYHKQATEAIKKEWIQFVENFPFFPMWQGRKCESFPVFPGWQKGVKIKNFPFFPINIKWEKREEKNKVLSVSFPGRKCFRCASLRISRFSPCGNTSGRVFL